MLIVTAAWAQEPAKTPEDLARAAVDAAYGKPVPREAVCFAETDLPGVFEDTLPTAVKRGSRGCVLLGALVGETWHPPEQAMAAAADLEAWKVLPADQQAQGVLSFTKDVLLAFDQPDGRVEKVTPSKGGFVVEVSYLRRDDAAGGSVAATGRWTFDATLALTAFTETVEGRWVTSLYARPDRLEGVPEKVVSDAITAHGGVVKQCFTEAWQRDLALEGPVRLEWTVAGGKVAGIGVIADDDPPQDLATCYARAVRPGAYPAELAGKVRWVFGVDRRAVE